MKKQLITLMAVISISFTSFASASTQNDDVAYLFGTQDAIEMQVISTDEMAMTEGQLFGITTDQTISYLLSAAKLLKPTALALFKKIEVPLVNFFLKRVNAYFQTLPGGSDLPPLVAS